MKAGLGTALARYCLIPHCACPCVYPLTLSPSHTLSQLEYMQVTVPGDRHRSCRVHAGTGFSTLPHYDHEKRRANGEIGQLSSPWCLGGEGPHPMPPWEDS